VETISCIVPVYNNEATILQVLNALRACAGIDEIIAVDDYSRDNSARLIEGMPGVRLIMNPRNLGKGGAVMQGLRHSRGDTILLCDADLAKLQPHHIERLIEVYRTGEFDMVIAGRETAFGWGYLMSILSGERIFQRKQIEPYTDLIAAHGNGIEQIINFAHKGQRVKLILSKDIGHVLKYKKTGVRVWFPSYVLEVSQLLETEYLLNKISITNKIRRWRKSLASF
jgi:glycosyltransferase involved in cell wall biosynthesis